jgi:hypothetical protein
MLTRHLVQSNQCLRVVVENQLIPRLQLHQKCRILVAKGVLQREMMLQAISLVCETIWMQWTENWPKQPSARALLSKETL